MGNYRKNRDCSWYVKILLKLITKGKLMTACKWTHRMSVYWWGSLFLFYSWILICWHYIMLWFCWPCDILNPNLLWQTGWALCYCPVHTPHHTSFDPCLWSYNKNLNKTLVILHFALGFLCVRMIFPLLWRLKNESISMCEISTVVMALVDMDMSCKQFNLVLIGRWSV